MLTNIIIVIAFLLSFIIPFGIYIYYKRSKGSVKAAFGFHIFLFFTVLIISNIILYTGHAQAAATTTAAATDSAGFGTGLKLIAAALSTGLSCIGGGIAVASSASAALGAISEDSSIMGKSLIFVALAEGIALYGLIISFMILNA